MGGFIALCDGLGSSAYFRFWCFCSSVAMSVMASAAVGDGNFLCLLVSFLVEIRFLLMALSSGAPSSLSVLVLLCFCLCLGDLAFLLDILITPVY